MIKWILSCALICLAVLLIRQVFRKKISPKLQYMLWAIVLIRLLIPFDIGHSRFSVANLFPVEYRENAYSAEALTSGKLADEKLADEKFIVESLKNESFGAEGLADQKLGAEGVESESLGAKGVESENSEAQKFATENFEAQNLPAKDLEVKEVVKEESDFLETLAEVTKAGMVFKLLALIGMIVIGIVFLISYLHLGRKFRRSRKLCTRDADPLPVYLTNAVDTPCLFGLFSPAIYLPEEYSDIPDARLHAVTHEWVHFRHKDHIWAILRTICLVLHWYNPFVWVAAKCSITDAELACDADTIRLLGDDNRKSYGNTLIQLTDRGNPSLLFSATAMSSTSKQLKERIQMIMKKPKKNKFFTGIALSLCLIVGGTTLLGAKRQTSDFPALEEVLEEDGYSFSIVEPSVEDTNPSSNQKKYEFSKEIKPLTMVLTDRNTNVYDYKDTRQTKIISKRWINETDVRVISTVYPLYSPINNSCFDVDPELADTLGESYYMLSAYGVVTCPERYLGDEAKKEKWENSIGSADRYFATFRKSENVNIIRCNNRLTVDESLRDDTDFDEVESKASFEMSLLMQAADELWLEKDVLKEGTDTYITNVERMPILYSEAGEQFAVYRLDYFTYEKADKKVGESQSKYFVFHLEKVDDIYALTCIRCATSEYMKSFLELFEGNPGDEKYKRLLKQLTKNFESEKPDYTSAIDYCENMGIQLELMCSNYNDLLTCYADIPNEMPIYYNSTIHFNLKNGNWEPSLITIKPIE